LTEITGKRRISFYLLKTLKDYEHRTNLKLLLIIVIIALMFIYFQYKFEKLESTVLQLQRQVFEIWGRLDNMDILLKQLQRQVFEIWGRLDNMDIQLNVIANDVTSLYGRVDTLQSAIDKIYTENLVQGSLLKIVDDKIISIFEFFATQPESRKHFGLGCFVEGTLITIDEVGNRLPVEKIFKGRSIWNPWLKRYVPIIRTVAGPETGCIYKILLSDGTAVTVTESHPMKVRENKNESWDNIAAKNIKIGDIMETINGIQSVVGIESFAGEGRIVHNLQYDLPEDVPVFYRSIISDGVHTLDLFAQKQHQ